MLGMRLTDIWPRNGGFASAIKCNSMSVCYGLRKTDAVGVETAELQRIVAPDSRSFLLHLWLTTSITKSDLGIDLLVVHPLPLTPPSSHDASPSAPQRFHAR